MERTYNAGLAVADLAKAEPIHKQHVPERVTDAELDAILRKDWTWAGTPDVGTPIEVRLAAELAALRAPVDVDTDPLTCAVLDAADGIYPGEIPPGGRFERVAAALRPHVEHLARLAREAEGLQAELTAEQTEHDETACSLDNRTDDLDAARVEIGRIDKELQEARDDDLCRERGDTLTERVQSVIAALRVADSDMARARAALCAKDEEEAHTAAKRLRAEVERIETARADERARWERLLAELNSKLMAAQAEINQLTEDLKVAVEAGKRAEHSRIVGLRNEHLVSIGRGQGANADRDAVEAFEEALASSGGASKPAPAERTPETVLRAMVAAYDAMAWDRKVAWAKEPTSANHEAMGLAVGAASELSGYAAFIVAGREGYAFKRKFIRADYEARLSGARQLDAPPMEEP